MISVDNFVAGHFERGFEYKYFVPIKINEEWEVGSMALFTLLESAAKKLGELNSFAKLVPNVDLYIKSHVVREAVISSKIEGTQTRMEEALMSVEEIAPARRDDWQEVINYIEAMHQAIDSLETLPISSRLIKSIHKTLLNNVRGQNKRPGEFRNSQNWIGGNSIMDAVFIPPSHQLVNECMGDFENFLYNKDTNLSSLLKIAIAHYQFETIHPFLDGNGRIGRLLITLFLVGEKILDQPLLYMSAYFEKNRILYYDNLMRVRENNDLLHWIKYFLVGIEQTATEAVERFSNVLKMKQEKENVIKQWSSSKSTQGLKLLDNLFLTPILSIDSVSKICEVTYPTANSLVKLFMDNGMLEEQTGNSRNRIFAFTPYLDVFFNN